MRSFFDKNYQTPVWLTKKLSRRQMLKSAAGATAIASASSFAFLMADTKHTEFETFLKTLVWQTLDAVFDHIFPASNSGPSAKDIQATFYLFQLIHQQPTGQDEIDFVYQGIGWLNGDTQSKEKLTFVDLDTDKKEQMLRAISRSSAGKNWLNMMILNLYEAMLSPPAYGGNPAGIGWTWINHQAGFPLPPTGKRYFELPPRSQAPNQSASTFTSNNVIISKDLFARKSAANNKGRTKA